MIRVATFNLHWLGHPRAGRAAADHARLADVLRAVDADLWALQEVDDLALLARLLPRPYTLYTGVRRPYPLKPVIAVDPRRVRVYGWEARVAPAGRRKPLVLDVEGDVGRFRFVCVHLAARDAAARAEEVSALGQLPGPVVYAGDFNAGAATLGALGDPRFPSTWTSWQARAPIDGFVVRGAAVTQVHAVAFDLAHDGRAHHHRGRRVELRPEVHGDVPELYAVSDHRPVVGRLCAVDPARIVSREEPSVSSGSADPGR